MSVCLPCTEHTSLPHQQTHTVALHAFTRHCPYLPTIPLHKRLHLLLLDQELARQHGRGMREAQWAHVGVELLMLRFWRGEKQ